MNSAAFAGTCPTNPVTVTCTQEGSSLPLVISRQSDQTYVVGASKWPGGKNQAPAGSNTFYLNTGKYDLDHMACDIDLLDVTNETGTLVAIDCGTGDGAYGHYESQNFIEDGSPCSHVQGELSSCVYQ